ncbi:signal transduction histidine kinase [Saccharopolyspora lacisalsi]|uniref:histidine kinase n=1 Tax=Halosaccharopolyspora lacisalsi TaxID=1000566 RepID=A0A839E2B7_9PSEU|nr:nitrate- and nitrite sensing domain-containing protein [Halosaccharopolyspora lacisalsi]MBA8826706.1 signal transduction histidine kinase [Halosaccharopolyspora lacisalsi]
MRNWRLRTKLLLVLLIPSIAALSLGAFQVSSDYAQADTLAANSKQVELDTSAGKVVHELQRERDLTVAYIASGRTANRAELNEQRAAVDRAIEQFRSDIRQARQSSHSEVATRFAAAASDLDRLANLRKVSDNSDYPADAAVRAYTESVDRLLRLGERGITEINNPELVQLYLATNALSRAQEQESVKRALLAAALHSGGFGPSDQRALLSADAELDAALSDFRKWATPAQEQAYSDTVTGLMVDRARTVEETALVRAQEGNSFSDLSPQEWMRYSTETVNLNYQVTRQLRDQLQNKVDSLASAANTQTYVAAVLVVGALILAFAIALMVARSLLLPLRTLRRSALDVADNRLPDSVDSILEESNPDGGHGGWIEPIPVHTQEEIGRVARSFDAVHSQALRLASEQALLRNNVNDLFVNLARRSQTLVQRQLALIERLEQDEQDPDQLSSLFELDHLATRMRRNNENLLILGGTDLTRRMVKPVALTEVVGAAVSEVEQYARIAISEAPELAIQGRIVNDVVHLIAELLENATVYSNPDTEVTVHTAYRRQELVLEIRDRGVGIDASDLSEINERLVRTPEVDVSVSRRMGLYVVGQLSRRHNIGVELHNNDDLEGGVTARVHISGEFVVQLTPNGPMPMPDVQRPADEQRDALSDTGTQKGLAAAFAQNGTERNLPEPEPPQRGLPQREPSEPVAPLGSPEPEPDDEQSWPVSDIGEEFATSYSVQIASGDSYGASDVPRWEDEPDDVVAEAEWPREDARIDVDPGDGHDGRCGVPPGIDDPGGLFHSPFEAEKTTQFERITESYDTGWEDAREGTAETPIPVDSGVGAPAVAATSDSQPEGTASDMDDAPTQRLPIYEAVLSQWFREPEEEGQPSPSEPVSSRDGAAHNGHGESAAVGAIGGRARARRENEPHEPGIDEARAPGSMFNGAPVDDAETGVSDVPRVGRRAATRDQRDRVAQARQDEAQSTADPGWGAGDAGWQAAEALASQDQQQQETTTAGLPKRNPKSNLVPGSAAAQPQSPAPAPEKPTAPRSADAVRGRMSNFQQGVRRGRHAKAEFDSTDEQSRSIPSRPEEQE